VTIKAHPGHPEFRSGKECDFVLFVLLIVSIKVSRYLQKK